MKAFLFNQFNLSNIDNFDLDKCADTLAFLRYILKRAESEKEQSEIKNYMEQIDQRCQQLKISKAA
jgi:hypothetical protein